jgi:hypothetical protein
MKRNPATSSAAERGRVKAGESRMAMLNPWHPHTLSTADSKNAFGYNLVLDPRSRCNAQFIPR